MQGLQFESREHNNINVSNRPGEVSRTPTRPHMLLACRCKRPGPNVAHTEEGGTKLGRLESDRCQKTSDCDHDLSI